MGRRGRVGHRESLRGSPHGESDRSHRARGRDRLPSGTPAPRLEGRRADRPDLGRAGDRQVPPCGGSRKAHRRRVVHALALPMFASPHQPPPLSIHRQLERAAGFKPDDASHQRLDKLAALLAIAAPRVQDATPLFAALLSIPFGDRFPGFAPSPAQQRRRTFAALLDQFESLAGQKPILLLFEDVHWADATSLDLLDLLVERMRQLPVLALFTLRPEFEPSWIGLPNVGTLALCRLDRSNVESIVTQVCHGRALPAEVMNEIVAKTDGNPLFVEELTKAVLEMGILVKDAEGYRLDGPLPPLAIPDTLQDSLMARLDRLAPVK